MEVLEVQIFDAAIHTWTGGGVTGETALKVLAGLHLHVYKNHPQFTLRDDGQSLAWCGWIIRLHGEDGTALPSTPEPQRKVTLVCTHDPKWTAPETDNPHELQRRATHGDRGSQAELNTLLREKTWEQNGPHGGAKVYSLRDQIVNAFGDHFLPASSTN